MAASQAQVPRLVRAAPDPLGWYLRPSCVDHRTIADAITGGSVGLHGVVFDPLHLGRHSEMRHLIVERNRDAILDPRTQELGSIGGFNNRAENAETSSCGLRPICTRGSGGIVFAETTASCPARLSGYSRVRRLNMGGRKWRV